MTASFIGLLQDSFARYGSKTAIVSGDEHLSYNELYRRCRAAADNLQQRGLTQGGRVAVCVREKVPLLISHLGVILAGGVSLPLNPRFTRKELRYFLRDSGAAFALVGASEAEKVSSAAAGQSGLTLMGAEIVPCSPVATSLAGTSLSADSHCFMLYSSGTTGEPKGVVHNHRNVAASLLALQQVWQFTADDTLLNVLPLFHIHGLSFAAHLALISGSRMILEDRFHPRRTMTNIARATVFMGVPPMYYAFLRRKEFAHSARLWDGVRLLTCGSAPIRTDSLRLLQRTLGRSLVNRYGMTESHVITSNPVAQDFTPGTVGNCLPGVQLHLVDKEGCEIRPGAKDKGGNARVGEVRIQGSNLFDHYWGRPQATRSARDAQGFFCTGDLGFLNEMEELTLVGRVSDLIITDGYNVYPPVVERVLNEHQAVAESAVVGLADMRHGERVVAFVVPDCQVSAKELSRHCQERLVHYQRPVQYHLVDTLPRNTMGKVLKRELRNYGDE